MSQQIEVSKVPEKQIAAFYGLVFAAAATDGCMSHDELMQIFGIMNLDQLSKQTQTEIKDYVATPPDLNHCLAILKQSSDELKFSVAMNIMEVLLSDNLISPDEESFLEDVYKQLGVSKEQRTAIENFIRKAKEIAEKGVDDNVAESTLKDAAAGLAATGVPIAAVYLSGSVIGLSAAGISSGLAAIGLGLGMVPGIGIAILLGTAIFVGLRKVLGDSKKTKEKQIAADRERKAQLVIKNLTESVNVLLKKINDLEVDAKANQERLNELKSRLFALNQMLKTRKQIACA
jgi:hypothetical protein